MEYADIDEKLLEEDEIIEREKEAKLINILKFISPGTPLREGIDNVMRAEKGALIVIGDSADVMSIVNGGFHVNSDFTPQKLVELSKMDGAVILDSQAEKILFCNSLLVPNHNIKTGETGTRHQAAERTAKQTGKLTIAVSERRKIVSIYFEDLKYTLRGVSELLDRANENLRVLEKNKEIFDELMMNLNVLEFTALVSISDFSLVIQRAEILRRIAPIVKRYIVELGKEGSLVSMQLREIMKDVEKEEMLILKDYCKDFKFSRRALAALSIEELIDSNNIVSSMLYSTADKHVVPRGYRLLSKIFQDSEEVGVIVRNFKFDEILEMIESENIARISEILPGKEEALKGVLKMKEQVLLGKKI